MIKKAGKWNGISLPTNLEKVLSSTSDSGSPIRVSIFDLFQKGYKRTTALLAVVWFSIILLYFGITLHMGSLGGDIYLNVV
jgi:OCT family organic cation transporter-like MFS transporter 4/5